MRPSYNLISLSRDSTILFFLRTLFGVMADYGVYMPEEGEPVILSKGQLAFLVERGCADALVKTLPELVSRNIVHSVQLNEFEAPEEVRALFIESSGAFLTSLARALSPDEPQYPEWWDAPVPFAICSRGVLRLNPTAVKMFGNGLEKLNARELPDRDEFIVRLESPEQSRFMAFKRLRPSIFTLDDCTEDLVEAQDITWWAAVGRSWVKEIESQGGKWQRLDLPPDDNSDEQKKLLQCDWQGQTQGYLCIEEMENKESEQYEPKEEVEKTTEDAQLQFSSSSLNSDNSDSKLQLDIKPKKANDVLKDIGPQAMALLAAGQPREDYEIMG